MSKSKSSPESEVDESGLREELKRIAKRIELAKQGHPKLTNNQLAEDAAISINTLLKLIQPSQHHFIVHAILRGRKRKVNGRIWATIISQIAVALKGEPTDWLKPGPWGYTGTRDPEFLNLRNDAVSQISKHPRRGEPTWRGRIEVTVMALPPLSSSPSPPTLETDNSFLGVFSTLVLKAVGGYDVKFNSGETNLKVVGPDFKEQDRRHDVNAGVFKLASREMEIHELISIPGWRMRLSCLANANTVRKMQITWSSLLRDKWPFYLLTVDHSAPEDFVISYLQRSNRLVNNITSLDSYKIISHDISYISKQSYRFFSDMSESPSIPLLVTTEPFAYQLKRILRHAVAPIELVDLLEGVDTAPTFEVAMQIRLTDKDDLIKQVRAVIQGSADEESELFGIGAMAIAPVYARLLVAQLREVHVDQWLYNSAAKLDPREQPLYTSWLSYLQDERHNTKRTPPKLPGFARLHDFQFRVPRTFIFALLDELSCRLLPESDLDKVRIWSDRHGESLVHEDEWKHPAWGLRNSVRDALQLLVPQEWAKETEEWANSRLGAERLRPTYRLPDYSDDWKKGPLGS